MTHDIGARIGELEQEALELFDQVKIFPAQFGTEFDALPSVHIIGTWQ